MPASPTLNVLPQHERLDSIDALRGIAAMMVAGYHIWGHYGVYPWVSLGVVPTTAHAGLFAYLVSPLRWGYLGVSLFLVLSGFCIHLPLARRRGTPGAYGFDAKSFYLRRMWRLYPAYAISVIATFVLLTIAYPSNDPIAPSHNMGDLISHLTLTHGFFDSYFYSITNVYWSLALEFQLYLLYPLFLYAFWKIGVTRGIVLLTIFSIAWRYVSLTYFGHQLISISWTGPYAMMGFVFARMPEWLFGAWLAEWFVSGRFKSANRFMLWAASIMLLYGAILTSFDQRLWSLTDIVFGLGFAFAIAASIVPRRNVALAKPRVFYRSWIWLGTISYSIYLFHQQLSWFAKPLIDRLPGDHLQFAVRTLVLVASIPIIAVIYRFVESPFLKRPRPKTRFYGLYKRLERWLGIKPDAEIVASSA